jgi:hypothetical protein
MIHLVLLARLVLHDIQQKVDRTVGVLRRRTVAAAIRVSPKSTGGSRWDGERERLNRRKDAQDRNAEYDDLRVFNVQHRVLAVTLRPAIVVHRICLRGWYIGRGRAVEHIIFNRRCDPVNI